MVEVTPPPLAFLVDVINGWSARVREEAGDADAPYPDPTTLARTYGVDLGVESDAKLRPVANQLHTVFAAETPEARRDRLNELIRALQPIPSLAADGHVWLVPDPSNGLVASLVLALFEYAHDDPSLDRLGVCRAHRCVDAYIDHSQARTRRYCSLTCQNRAKAAAHRRRRTT